MDLRYDFIQPNNRPSGIGKNLYILGTSEDGPYMHPTLIADPTEAETRFGSEDKGDLVRAFKEAYEINQEISIYLMRITGKSATLNIGGFLTEEQALDGDARWTDEALSFYTTHAGERYNDIRVVLETTPMPDMYLLRLITPEGDNFVYNLSDYENIGHLTRAINQDCRSGLHPMLVSSELPDAPVEIFFPNFEYDEDTSITESLGRAFEEGEDGLDVTKNDLYIALDQAYELLKGRQIDILTVPGARVDDVYPKAIYTSDKVENSAYYALDTYAANRDYLDLLDTLADNQAVSFQDQMINFCKEQMALGYMTHGVMGFNSMEKIPDIHVRDDSYILQLIATAIVKDRYGLNELKGNDYIDKGYFVSLVFSDVIFNKGLFNEYYTNAATTYAAIMTGYFDTTTNAKLPETVTLRYEISDSTMAELARYGVVSYRDSVRHGLVVNSGVTASLWTHELHNVANLRMVQLTIGFINDAVDSLYANDVAYSDESRRSQIESLISQRLNELVRMGVLIWFDYRLVFAQAAPIGAVYIKLMTKYTVEAISTSAKIERRE